MPYADVEYVYDPRKAILIANYPLLANPRRYYYTQRRGAVLFICIHILAGIDDWIGTDDSAEAGIRYGQTCTRAASWSATCDADTARDCLPDHYVAFAQGVPYGPENPHGLSYNTHGYGIEIGARSTDWTKKPVEWVEATLRNLVKLVAPRCKRYGIRPVKVTKAELDRDLLAGRPSGIIGHSDITPGTRTDPGKVNGRDTFPWERFLELLRAALAGTDPELEPWRDQLVAAGLPVTHEGKEKYMTTLDQILEAVRDKGNQIRSDLVLDGGTGDKRHDLIVRRLDAQGKVLAALAEKVAAGDAAILDAIESLRDVEAEPVEPSEPEPQA